MLYSRFSSVSRHFVMIVGLCACFVSAANAVDVTTVGATPDDGIDDSMALNDALQNYPALYFPPGVYHIAQSLVVPSNRAITGANSDSVTLEFTNDDANTLTIFNAANVYIANLGINRSFTESLGVGIFGENSQGIVLDSLLVTGHRSRSPAVLLRFCEDSIVRNCVVRDYQRIFFEDGNDQVFGVGIRVAFSTGCTVENNLVEDTQGLTLAGPYINYYQAGGIEGSSSQDCEFLCNTVITSGNGIDVGAAVNCVVEGNTIRDIQQVGIKLVNGSTAIQVRHNIVERCGLFGIGLLPGNQDLGVVDSMVEDNTLNEIGQSMQTGWWDGQFGGDAPAGIFMDSGESTAGISAGNGLMSNSFYNMEEATYTIRIRDAHLFGPTDTTVANNADVLGNPPPYSIAACAPDYDGDGLSNLDEVRDLDPDAPGIQNPFDPEVSDSTGDNFDPNPDGTPDGDNDWDGDGVSNAVEMQWGSNPLDPGSVVQLPVASVPTLFAAAAILALLAAIAVRQGFLLR